MDVRTSAGAKVPHAEFFPPPPAPRGPSLWLARLAEDRRAARPVLAGHPEHGHPGAAGPLSAVDPGLLLDAAQPALDAGDPRPGLLSPVKDVENYPLFLFAGMVPWSFLSSQPERLRRLHHRQRGPDPEDLPAEAGLSPGAGADRPGDVRASRSVRCSCCCGRWAPAVARDAGPAGGDRPVRDLQLGLGLIVATANTFYRDCGHLVSVFLQAWYFATPIIYPMSRSREGRSGCFQLNPAFYFIELFHDVLYAGRWPRIWAWWRRPP